MSQQRILYELGDYYIIRTRTAHEVYRNGETHSSRVATIASSDALKRAIDWIRKRKAAEDAEKALAEAQLS